MAAMDSHYMSNGVHRKNGLAPPKSTRYTGSLYTMTGSGAQVLMNTHTVVTATAMQFLPPIRTKSTMCSAPMPTITSPSFLSAVNFSDTKMPANHFHSASPAIAATAATTTVAAAVAGIPSKFDTCSYGPTATDSKTEGYPLFSAIKGFFSNLLKPIISTTTTMQYIPITTENSSGYATTNGKFQETSTNVYMNLMPTDIETSTFFDCDDYVDSEDTVDFIAGTTPKFDEINFEQLAPAFADSSPKSSAYFDCVSSFPVEKAIEKTDALTEVIKSEAVDVEPTMEPVVEVQAVKKCAPVQQQPHQLSGRCGLDSSQQSGDKTTHSYRKSKRNRRRPNKAIHRSAKSLVANKNRNEKHRHELEQLIHDDIECIHESASDFGLEDEDCIDSDMDARVRLNLKTADATPIASHSSASAASAPSPSIEPIFSEGTSSMFSCFISFDAPNFVRKPRPPPKMTPRRLQRWTSSDRPLHYRLSESESEDNYIVFDGVNTKSVSTDDLIGCDYDNVRKTFNRQRQMSECSDDFICFEYDESDLANCIHSDQTTDEEFSDTDDSDDESSDSETEECVFEQETHPPDSGFEERKVTFDLCPQVHEIRAWKFAYREARKGKWEQVGRDRERFEKKINEMGTIIAPVLSATHREKIFNERFREPAARDLSNCNSR